MGLVKTAVFTIFCIYFGLPICYGASTMAIDLGNDFTKVAVVLPGVPMEIALDSTSQRKIPTLVLLREGNRLFGNAAVASMTREPTLVFAELPSIIGKSIDHPTVVSYKARYPYHRLVFSNEFNQLAFVVNGKEFTVETLLAMFLEYVKTAAETYAASPMNTAVITVPSYFSQAERRALLRSTKLANIEVIQLFGVNAAIALHYILPRTKILEEKPDYMFVDVGSTATTVSVVSFQIAKTRGEEPGDFPHVFIRGTACDTSLGTNAFIDRLQSHLVDRFKAAKHITADVTKDPRAMAKFRKEALHVFKILSANKEIHSVIEEIFSGHDLNLKVTRSELENLCSDLVARFTQPILEALEKSNTPIAKIKEIILFGGGSRVPVVQSAILKETQRTVLSKTINSDEAAAMGAVYQAAYHTVGFRVKRFIVREANHYPIAVTFPRILTDDKPVHGAEASTVDDSSENVTRVLFPSNNAFPQKRTIKFPRLSRDLTFSVHYADGLSAVHERHLGESRDIMTIDIKEVAEGLKQYDSSVYTPNGVKTHFQLDDSGILRLSEVNLLMTAVVEQENKTEEVSTLKKLADGISNLFGTGAASTNDSTPEIGNSTTVTNATSDPTDRDTNESNKSISPDSPRNESDVQANATLSLPQNRTLIHPLAFSFDIRDKIKPPTNFIETSKTILQEYEAADEERRELERARNTLEESIFSTRNKLTDSAFVQHTTDEERSSLADIVASISQWYDDEGGFDSPRFTLEEQLDRLKEALNPLEQRVAAFAQIPVALLAMEKVVNDVARNTLLVMRVNSAEETVTPTDYVASLNDTANITTFQEKLLGLPLYSKEEVKTFEKIVAEEEKWLKDSSAAFKACEPTADPPVSLSSVTGRSDRLSAKMAFLMEKGENWFIMYKRLLSIKKSVMEASKARAKAEEEKNAKANDTAAAAEDATNTTAATEATSEDPTETSEGDYSDATEHQDPTEMLPDSAETDETPHEEL